MLRDAKVIAFVSTTDAAKATAFYRDVLGLRLIADEPVALVFDAGGTMLRIPKVEAVTPQPFTVLGWRVPDIVAAVDVIVAKGVRFARYNSIPQDERGIWITPTGDRVCWFQDPDGNTLSLTEFAGPG